MPAWNWSTIRTFAHCANSSGTLSDQTLSAFARHDFVVFEKFQGKTMAPVNHSAEAKIAAAARQIKKVNAQAEVYIYTAVDFVRSYYDGWAWFDDHPTAELHDKNGRLIAAPASVVSEWPGAHVFDFAQKEAQARWNAVVLKAIASGDLDGTYVDGIKSDMEFTRSLLSPASSQKRHAWLAGFNATMHALRVAVGSSKVLLQNSHSDWPRALDVRLQLGVDGKLDSTLSFQPGPTLLSDMQLVAATSPRIGAIYQSFAARGAVDDQMARYNTSLAAFLISMGPYSYWSYTPLLGAINRTTRRTMADGSWSCANWATPTGHEPDYLRPLGPPTGPALQCQEGKCARRFESGTCAFLDTTPTGVKHSSHASCIWWADGTHVGNVCDQPKPAACKSLKTDDTTSHGRVVHCRDTSDCTSDLQAAVDSGEDIKLAAGVWTVQPIYLRSSNQTITFGKDVEVVAKRMVAFGVLFTANASANLTIIGGGTQWRMQRADCASFLFPPVKSASMPLASSKCEPIPILSIGVPIYHWR